MPKAITVLLVEDNSDYRDVIDIALEETDDIQLCHEFGTAQWESADTNHMHAHAITCLD